MTEISSNKAFGGYIKKYKAPSSSLGGLETQFNVFIPSTSSTHGINFPVLIYLAGLTCNEDTGAWKGGFLPTAASEGIALVFPDTSPRGAKIEGEDDDWDFGTGAGFYIDATADKWAKHYRMFSLITQELPEILKGLNLPLDLSRQSIFGHSMGGHGALSLYLSPSTQYRSASAFAPICNPKQAPWGIKAFSNYLKGGVEEGSKYDSTHLLENAKDSQDIKLLIDYGDKDQFYEKGQLLPENFEQVVEKAGLGPDKVQIRRQEGYDHSYYFISTFAEEHVRFHAKILKG
ncbi:putative esterase D [Serendipita vermifera]|nr:putative esterase D [Serendipita vermifera]